MIIKKLKTHTYIFHEESRTLEMIPAGGGVGVEIDKVRMLSLMRFLIRVMARMAVRRIKHEKLNKT